MKLGQVKIKNFLAQTMSDKIFRTLTNIHDKTFLRKYLIALNSH